MRSPLAILRLFVLLACWGGAGSLAFGQIPSPIFESLCQDNAASTTVVATPSNGTLTNAGNTSASSVTGPGGSLPLALSFDGTDDYAGFGNITANGNAVTVLCWVYRRSGATQFDGIFTMRNTGTQLNGLIFQSSNRLAYQFSNNSATYTWNSGLTVPATTWCLCAMAVSSSDCKLYIVSSGGTVTATNSVANAAIDYARNVRIGMDSAGRESPINAAGARIYSATLSQSDIEAIYAADLAAASAKINPLMLNQVIQ